MSVSSQSRRERAGAGAVCYEPSSASLLRPQIRPAALAALARMTAGATSLERLARSRRRSARSRAAVQIVSCSAHKDDATALHCVFAHGGSCDSPMNFIGAGLRVGRPASSAVRMQSQEQSLTIRKPSHATKLARTHGGRMAMSKNTRMLVVDDFVTMTRDMRTLAPRIGFAEVDLSHDGETALAMLRAREYRFVLCDLEMQPMSGTEFARRARAEPSGSRCVIVLTTASRDSAARAVRDGIHLLIDGFILKPFNSEDLRAKLLEIMDRRSGKDAAAG